MRPVLLSADPSRETPLLARIARLPGKSPRYQATLPQVPVAGFGGGVKSAIAELEHGLRGFILRNGLGPTADAVLPLTHSGLELLGTLPDNIQFVPVGWSLGELSPLLSDDEVFAAAGRLPWSAFEDRIVSEVPTVWELSVAERFNVWLAEQDGLQPKRIAFDIRRGSKLLGCHRADRISIRPGRPGHETWRTFLHELAHGRVRGHRRPFVRELARVYTLFRTWETSERSTPTDLVAHREGGKLAVRDLPGTPKLNDRTRNEDSLDETERRAN